MKTMLTIALLPSGSSLRCRTVPATMVNANHVQWKAAPPVLPGAHSVLDGEPTKRACSSCVSVSGKLQSPSHTHPVDEIVTVISGEFNLGMGKEFNEAQMKPYTAGGLIAMPPGTEHFVRTKQETVVQISTRGPWALKYVNPEDKVR